MVVTRRNKEFRQRGWNGLHTAITICKLPIFGVQRSLTRQLAALQAADPDLIPVRGAEHVIFPGVAAPMNLNEVVANRENGISPPVQLGNAMEVV